MNFIDSQCGKTTVLQHKKHFKKNLQPTVMTRSIEVNLAYKPTGADHLRLFSPCDTDALKCDSGSSTRLEGKCSQCFGPSRAELS